MSETVTTYEPDNSLKSGYLNIFKEIVHEIRANKWLIYQLFKRDFFAAYKQSLFGVLWAFFLPIISVATFIVLNSSGVLLVEKTSVAYPLFALFGLAVWQLFATGLVAGSTSIVKAGSMIVKINFSKKALVISSLGQTVISFLIQMSLVFVFFVVFQTVPNIAILLTPILILPILLLTLGLSFILSILNGVIRDLGNLLPVITTFLMFLTPVMYPAPKSDLLALITTYNPLYYLVAVPRDLAFTGATTTVGRLFDCQCSFNSNLCCLLGSFPLN